jgi:4-hydroxybenzoyl-CoA thioesterase
MARVYVHRVKVEFGDCDPAGIVWYPNFVGWCDAASRNFFIDAGVPPWRELTRTRGILGTPLVDQSTVFHRPASYDDVIDIHTSIIEWGEKRFVTRYDLKRGDELLAEGRDTRVFCRRHPDDPKRIQALVVPEDIRKLCE